MNMYCRYCGTLVNEGASFCKCCGKPIVWQTQAAGAGAGEGAANGNVYFDKTIQSQTRTNYAGLEYREFIKVALLCVFTFGIYEAYMVYHMTKMANALEDEEQKSPALQTLLSILVPIYFWYWAYMNAKKLATMLKRTTGETGDYAVISLILSIASLGVGSILVMQLMVNKMLGDPKATSDEAVKSIVIAMVIQVALAIVVPMIISAIGAGIAGAADNYYESALIFMR